MRSRKEAIGMLAIVGACILALAGCSEVAAEEPIRTSTIVLSADGSFTQCRVESFEKEYYQLSELEDMVRQEVLDYVGTVSGQETEGNQAVTDRSWWRCILRTVGSMRTTCQRWTSRPLNCFTAQ